MSDLRAYWRDLRAAPRDAGAQLALVQALADMEQSPTLPVPVSWPRGAQVAVCAGSVYLRDVVETFLSALSDLGFAPVHRPHAPEDGEAAIVLERALWQAPPPADRDRRIFYNVEQLAQKADLFTDAFGASLAGVRVWDYGRAQSALWSVIAPDALAAQVPFAYAPIWPAPDASVREDIDVLFFGSASPRREAALVALEQAGLAVTAADGLFGADRDALIGRAKLVLMWAYERNDMFDVVRALPLLARGRAVVSDVEAHTDMPPGLRDAVALCADVPDLVAMCTQLCAEDGERDALAARGFVAAGQVRMADVLRPLIRPRGFFGRLRPW